MPQYAVILHSSTDATTVLRYLQDENVITQLRKDIERLKMVRASVQANELHGAATTNEDGNIESYVATLTKDAITNIVRGNAGPVTSNVPEPLSESGDVRGSARGSILPISEGARLLTTVLDEANQYSYFGGTIDQIKEVVQKALGLRTDLEKLSVAIQNYLDDSVSLAIMKSNEVRSSIQMWILTFNELTGMCMCVFIFIL